MSLPSYPKVYNVGHKYLLDLLKGTVTIQEKVDGSQFSFGIMDGRLQMRSKGQDVYDAKMGGVVGNAGMFGEAIEYLQTVATFMPQEFVFRAEYLQKPKHNALAYSRIPKNHLVLFDIEDRREGEGHFLPRTELENFARALDIDVVPHLYHGPVIDFDTMKWLSLESFLGGQQVEGFVIKNYNRFGIDGKPLFGKHVSEKFKEVHRKDWKTSNPSGTDVIEKIGQGLRTEARWDKAIMRRKEAGELLDAPQDIGPLLKSINLDLLEEESDAIKDALFKAFWPKLSRMATAGFPQFYKDRLLERQFDA